MRWTRIALAVAAAVTLLASATATASAAATQPQPAATAATQPREAEATPALMPAADICALATPTQAALSALCNLLNGDLIPAAIRPAFERLIQRHAEQLAPGFLKEHLQTWCEQQVKDHPDSKIARRCEQQLERLARRAEQQQELDAKCAAALADPKADAKLVERCKRLALIQRYQTQCAPLQHAATPDPALMEQCKQLREQLKASRTPATHRDEDRRPDQDDARTGDSLSQHVQPAFLHSTRH